MVPARHGASCGRASPSVSNGGEELVMRAAWKGEVKGVLVVHD